MTQRDRIAIIVVASVALLAAFWLGVLGPKRSEAAKLGKELGTEQQRLEQARSELETYKAARSRYSTSYATVARLGKAVPSDDDVPSLVYQLESTSKKTSVNFHSIKLTPKGGASAAPTGNAPATQAAAAVLPPGASVGAAGFPTMPFSFAFEGNFFRLSSFFARLEHFVSSDAKQIDVSGRLLTVDGISLTAAPRGFPTMRASVSATAYLLPEEEGPATGATPQGPANPAAPSGTPATPATTPATAIGPR